jgi:peptidoglycan hydrolase-like protein with peptidoglycan-binding domain
VALRGTSDRYRIYQRRAMDTALNCLPVSDIGGEQVMRRSRTLHVLGIAALSLAVAGGGRSVHARRAPPQPLSSATIGQVACSGATSPRITRAAIFKAQVVLDRLDISPGIIDGKTSENVEKAIAAFQRSRGYRSAAELLAEKFHTSEELTKLLNPGKTVDRAGTVITVPNVADGRPAGQVLRIEVDKPAKAVRAFGRNDEMVAFYPASVGSREKPAPSGTYRVGRVVLPITTTPSSSPKAYKPIGTSPSHPVPTTLSA